MAVLENPCACPCVAVVRLHFGALCRADDRESVRLRTQYGGAHIERHSCVRVCAKLRALFGVLGLLRGLGSPIASLSLEHSDVLVTFLIHLNQFGNTIIESGELPFVVLSQG